MTCPTISRRICEHLKHRIDSLKLPVVVIIEDGKSVYGLKPASSLVVTYPNSNSLFKTIKVFVADNHLGLISFYTVFRELDISDPNCFDKVIDIIDAHFKNLLAWSKS